MNVPVLLIGYNRSHLLEKSLHTLYECNVQNLYVYLDGPKIGKVLDEKKVQACHKIVDDYRNKMKINLNNNLENQGCKKTVIAAINWAFESEKELIILEDDIEFGSEFLEFMKISLKLYANEKDVLTISGHNRMSKQDVIRIDYNFGTYFTKFPDVWGWATWRNRWSEYDGDVFRKNKIKYWTLLKNLHFSPFFYLYLIYNFYLERVGKLDTWDYQWTYNSIINSRVNLISSYNLVKNIGFGEDATHTKFEIQENSRIIKNFTPENRIKIKIIERIEKRVQKNVFNQFIKAGFYRYIKRST